MAFLRWRAGYFKDAHRYLDEGQSLDPLNRNIDFAKLLVAFDEGDDLLSLGFVVAPCVLTAAVKRHRGGDDFEAGF